MKRAIIIVIDDMPRLSLENAKQRLKSSEG